MSACLTCESGTLKCYRRVNLKNVVHILFDLLSRSEDANKAFSQAVQMHDSLVMAWALWGDYLDGLFVMDRYDTPAGLS